MAASYNNNNQVGYIKTSEGLSTAWPETLVQFSIGSVDQRQGTASMQKRTELQNSRIIGTNITPFHNDIINKSIDVGIREPL